MPGFWELGPNHRVLCAILHTDMTTVSWAFGLRNLQLPGQFLPLAGMTYDHARNQACREALTHGFTHVFFLDSDVIPPHDTVHRLLKHDTPIISGMYCRRSPPHGVPVAIKDGNWLSHVPSPKQNPVVEVDLVGAGCLLLKREVLERFDKNPQPKRPEKWMFDWRVDAAGLFPLGQALSEDFTMCMRAKVEFGYKVLLDTSIRCEHVGYSKATLGSLAPMDCRVVT